MSLESLMPSNHLILSCPSPPAFNLFQHQGLFQCVSSLHQVAKVLEFSFSISPSSEYLALISFRMGFPGSSPGKESACNAGDVGLIPGWKDPLEKGVATHLLPGKSPWTEEPDGLQFMRWQSWTH